MLIIVFILYSLIILINLFYFKKYFSSCFRYLSINRYKYIIKTQINIFKFQNDFCNLV